MKKRFSEEQIIGILREGEADGAVIRDIAASTILRNRRREATGNPIPMSLPGYRLLCAMTTPPSFATVVPPKTEYQPTTAGRHLHEPVVALYWWAIANSDFLDAVHERRKSCVGVIKFRAHADVQKRAIGHMEIGPMSHRRNSPD
ncbi:hypothetical protein [Nitrosospira briensis]|uniref:hypothetical protein n=1 Tax=Nitrosospira briensis TaxID=35799 RepID=UPI00046AD4B4|nr:hypothetical protein [Nitrosospira briensis]